MRLVVANEKGRGNPNISAHQTNARILSPSQPALLSTKISTASEGFEDLRAEIRALRYDMIHRHTDGDQQL